jgi:prolyl-tRNA synthetase
MVRRDTFEKTTIRYADAIDKINEMLASIQSRLLDQAKRRMNEKTSTASTLDEAKLLLEDQGGFISTHWCGKVECEERLKEVTSADIRLIPFEGQDSISGKSCINCRLKAKFKIIIGRAY